MKKPVGYSVVGIDPGTATGLCWAVVGRSEVKRLGVVGALKEAKGDGRLVGEEVKGANEFDSAAFILAWVEVWQREAARRTRGRVQGHKAIVIEDFILRERTKDRSLLAPVRLTAMLEFGLRMPGSHGAAPALLPAVVVKQQPSDAKSTVTDDRLRRWDLWHVGSPHVRDATRHIITYLRRNERELMDGTL